ncbi:simple sugar transport system permease protein [Paenibacillus phyllosphaerae]|uniref:Simple sugar transport system permease protein n=1 Tax=Paenibacillus phyllosphaerae TaxID=274593 RepID=A0A7W5FKR4_9BACL|nr:ABC transporter permease [Paenibacillus phyllosphaerae]MBB3108192.1 simple sugar transport system permease protein [Paenibacillus phyllosphaerae]
MTKLAESARSLSKHPITRPLLALAFLYVLMLIIMPSFFKLEMHDGHLYGNLIDILKNGAPLIIIALGMTLVIAVEGIDISVGSVLAISGAAAIYLLDGYPLWIALIAAAAVGIVCGMWNGMLVAILQIQPMVATLILLTIGRGIAQLITSGQILSTSEQSYMYLGKGYLIGLPFPIFLAAGIFLLLYLFKTKTAFGLFLESAGGSKTASLYAGVKPRTILMIAYTITGLCAAIGGIIVSANLGSADSNNAGLWIELDAILAVVIGGTSMRGGRFYLGGTVVGALFIQSLTTTIYALGIPPQSILLVKAVVVIVVCLMQSDVFRKKLAFTRKKVLAE